MAPFCDVMGQESTDMRCRISELEIMASVSHLDLGRAPYVLYGVKYIDLVSLW